MKAKSWDLPQACITFIRTTDAGKELPAAIVQQQKEREERRKARAAKKAAE